MDPDLFLSWGQKLLDTGKIEDFRLLEQIVAEQARSRYGKSPYGVQYCCDDRWWWPCNTCMYVHRKLTIVRKQQQIDYLRKCRDFVGMVLDEDEDDSVYCDEHRHNANQRKQGKKTGFHSKIGGEYF